jgi:hypothetical protein
LYYHLIIKQDDEDEQGEEEEEGEDDESEAKETGPSHAVILADISLLQDVISYMQASRDRMTLRLQCLPEYVARNPQRLPVPPAAGRGAKASKAGPKKGGEGLSSSSSADTSAFRAPPAILGGGGGGASMLSQYDYLDGYDDRQRAAVLEKALSVLMDPGPSSHAGHNNINIDGVGSGSSSSTNGGGSGRYGGAAAATAAGKGAGGSLKRR